MVHFFSPASRWACIERYQYGAITVKLPNVKSHVQHAGFDSDLLMVCPKNIITRSSRYFIAPASSAFEMIGNLEEKMA